MMARDGPENSIWNKSKKESFRENGRLAEIPKTLDFAPARTPSKKAPVSRLISTPKASTDTGIKRTRKPPTSKAKKPPKMDGYSWRKDGAGWELRKSVYDVSDTGIRKRRLPYVAHLSRSAFGELKKRHKGKELEKAIATWIQEHDRS